jgi:hypothetical protein
MILSKVSEKVYYIHIQNRTLRFRFSNQKYVKMVLLWFLTSRRRDVKCEVWTKNICGSRSNLTHSWLVRHMVRLGQRLRFRKALGDGESFSEPCHSLNNSWIIPDTSVKNWLKLKSQKSAWTDAPEYFVPQSFVPVLQSRVKTICRDTIAGSHCYHSQGLNEPLEYGFGKLSVRAFQNRAIR